MSKTTKKESIVKPNIEIAGHVHPFIDIVSGPNVPEMKSVGYMRLTPDSSNWISYTITTKGEKVISIEVDEPNLRKIAEESSKISFVNTFSDQD